VNFHLVNTMILLINGPEFLDLKCTLTKRTASLHNNQPQRIEFFRRWLRRFAILAGLFAFLIANVEFASRHDCVVMPNGLLIGRATLFSKMVGWGPDIAIKYPDGRLLRRGDGLINFFDKESVGGDYPEAADKKFNKFIYINEVGLLVRSEDPLQFQYYWDKKKRSPSDKPLPTRNARKKGSSPWRWSQQSGTRHWVGGYETWRWTEGSSNLFLIYDILRSERKNRRDWCPTAWFTP